jgi:DNA-directed RNA polymerase I subunit RPA2
MLSKASLAMYLTPRIIVSAMRGLTVKEVHFQVRSVGRNNPLTRQPIKGRKVGGGIRFGEMERDSLLAHGAAYLLHDRLHYCSDYHVVDVCSTCGSMLTLQHEKSPSERLLGSGGSVVMGREERGSVQCTKCAKKKKSHTERVAMPYVLKYLIAELAMMNIKVTFDIA